MDLRSVSFNILRGSNGSQPLANKREAEAFASLRFTRRNDSFQYRSIMA